MSRLIGLAACVATVSLCAGCGGGGAEQLIAKKALRDCLAHAGIAERPLDSGVSGASGYASIYSPDFTAYTRNGVGVDVIVEGSDSSARSTAAHVKGASASLGAAGAANRVVTSRNAVIVFTGAPSSADRAAVRTCLASS